MTARHRRRSLIPWLFVAGLGLVVAVNMVLILAATSSATGVVVGKRHEADQVFTQKAAQEKEQARRGWHVDARLDPQGRIAVSVRGSRDEPLNDLSVSARFVRPVEGESPPVVRLAARGGGTYAGEIALPHRGQWEMTVVAETKDARYEAVSRWVVP